MVAKVEVMETVDPVEVKVVDLEVAKVEEKAEEEKVVEKEEVVTVVLQEVKVEKVVMMVAAMVVAYQEYHLSPIKTPYHIHNNLYSTFRDYNVNTNHMYKSNCNQNHLSRLHLQL